MKKSANGNGLISITCGKHSKYSAEGLCDYISDYLAMKHYDEILSRDYHEISGSDIKKVIEAYENGSRVIFKNLPERI